MSKRHVLVVDDDPLILEVLRTVLDLEEFRVTTATDGTSGLAMLAQDRPDVVVVDVMMPGLDGLEVCRRIKSDPATANVPVVLLTARDRVEDQQAGEAAGCDAYLTKPFSPLYLIDVIADIRTGQSATGGGTPAEGVGRA
jgi:two-component system, OmpR family, response regulator MprA